MRERTPFDRALLDRLPDLRLLVTTGMANASIDLDAARDRGVLVCGTRSRQPGPAELTWALVLAVTRRVAQEDAAVRAGGWQTTIGPELSGRTLGVLGLGRLGSIVAGYGRAFGMRVLGWSANLDPGHARELGVEPVTLDDLLTRSDVVSVHLTLSDRTRGLLGARELDLIGPEGYLVNTSRGPIVDEAALVQALRAGRIAGAGLDVFDVEPLPADHPLRTVPRAVLTPHIGYVALDAYRVFYADAVEDVIAWMAGEPVRVLC
jgi:phosphoglycerate dehydrogenase-like enzyme